MILDCPCCGTKHVQTADCFRQVERAISGYKVTWDIRRCQNPKCLSLILVMVDSQSGERLRIFPPGTYELDAELGITKETRDDYREAGLCLAAGCYRASLVMSRRALQRCLKEQGCSQRNLGGKNGALRHAIDEGILRKAFHPLANEIIEYGNLGAHPDDDQLESANLETAQHVLAFLVLIVDEFYRIPSDAEKLRRGRERAAGQGHSE